MKALMKLPGGLAAFHRLIDGCVTYAAIILLPPHPRLTGHLFFPKYTNIILETTPENKIEILPAGGNRQRKVLISMNFIKT